MNISAIRQLFVLCIRFHSCTQLKAPIEPIPTRPSRHASTYRELVMPMIVQLLNSNSIYFHRILKMINLIETKITGSSLFHDSCAFINSFKNCQSNLYFLADDRITCLKKYYIQRSYIQKNEIFSHELCHSSKVIRICFKPLLTE